MSRLPAIVSMFLAAACIGLLGCGGESEEDRVATAAEQFAQAGAGNDYETFCALLTEGARAPIEEFAASRLDVPEDERCQAGLEATGGTADAGAETEVTDVTVDGDTATAVVTNTLTDEAPVTRELQLQQESGEWLVADYGGPA